MDNNQHQQDNLAKQKGKILLVDINAVEELQKDASIEKLLEIMKSNRIQWVDLNDTPKPIALIKLNHRFVRPEQVHNVGEHLRNMMPDYHVLVVPDDIEDNISISVFNVEDLETVTIEELKKQVDDALNQTRRSY